VYLKCKGQNPNLHPVKKELERVQTYMLKIKQQANPILQEVDNKPRLRVDADATQRIIQHELSANQRIPETRKRKAKDISTES
jgi:hypothetical protein